MNKTEKKELEELLKVLSVEYEKNELLARHTTLGVGGMAEFFVRALDIESVAAVCRFAFQNKTALVPIGYGSNILFSDEGISGIVLKPELKHSNLCESDTGYRLTIAAGAMYSLARLASSSVKESLKGMEGMTAIPGSVGGALVMNAGAYGCEMSKVAVSFLSVRDGVLNARSVDGSDFSYRCLNSLEEKEVVCEVTVELKKADDKELLMKETRKRNRARRKNQPYGVKTAGSVFRNPPGEKAWRLIEMSGCRGLRIGDAKVSEKHCNFIEVGENTSSDDVISLIEKIRKSVFESSGIQLELEIKTYGFEGEQK